MDFGSCRQNPPENLTKEMTHILKVNFNKLAPFRNLQDHEAKSPDTSALILGFVDFAKSTTW